MAPSEQELAAVDTLCTSIFHLFESYPRSKDQVVDPMRAAALGGEGSSGAAAPMDISDESTPYAENYAATAAAGSGAAAGPRGALVVRAPIKQLQVMATVVSKSKAATTAERFKPLAMRCKWVATDALPAALDGVEPHEGLQARLGEYDPSRQFVTIVVVELASGDARCQHSTVTGVASVEDRAGPWQYVLDHGAARTETMPKFLYNGSLIPYRVSPDRPVPDHIAKPDYYTTGQAEAERRHEARNTPPVHTEKEIKKMRKANRLGREILDAAHRIIRPGVTTDEIDRVVHEYTVCHCHVSTATCPLPRVHCHVSTSTRCETTTTKS